MGAAVFSRIARAGVPVALVSVLEVRGPYARHSGHRLLVTGDGCTEGTLGDEGSDSAGREAGLAALAGRRSTTLSLRLGDGGSAAGRTGAKRFLVEYIDAFLPYQTADARLSAGRRVLFVKAVPSLALPQPEPLPVALYDASGTLLVGAALPVDPARIRKCLDGGKAQLDDQAGLLYDPVLPQDRLLILGAGHVGRALARAAAEIGFSVSIADDRGDLLANALLDDSIVRIPSDYAVAVENFAADAATYVVVVTRGHYQDLECLRVALKKKCRYVGCIGSQRKGRLLIGQLRSEGLDDGLLATLHIPVGLDLNAETPAEVAIAILAEMVAVRRNAASLDALKLARKVED